jgi:hypothetical protein
MSDVQWQPAPSTSSVATLLLHPSTLLLVAANAIPLVGVLLWHWDAFLLLMLYWMETAIIGFWTVARIAASPPGTFGPLLINRRPATSSSLAMAAFFIVHSGVFMGVHMVFLWAVFSGDWSRRIHGLHDALDKIVIETGLWIPLLALFASRGGAFLFHVLKPELIRRLEQLLQLPVWLPAAATDAGAIIGGFYGRIVIMQLTIIFGAFLAGIFGSLAPLIIMIVLKTLVDVVMHLSLDFGRKSQGTAAES